jgi:COMPASS component SWD3
VRIYDEETKTCSIELVGTGWQTAGHNNRVFSIKFSPEDPNIIVRYHHILFEKIILAFN